VVKLNVKNKKLFLSITVVVICLTAVFGVNYKKMVDAVENQVGTKIILIDPGHGGIDGGAVSKNGTVEKNINLSIGLKLRKQLQEKGYKVLMTREEDKGLYSDNGTIRNKKNEDLNNRCKLKRESNCNMFISIHLNIFPESKYYGAQVWYSNNEESKKFAHAVQTNLIKDLNNNNRRVEKPAKNAYKVLRCNDTIPSILVECGFLSNPDEERKLKTEEYQQILVESIANSIDKYYE
jgi:N-acetylmuramoyl-L-alanine amidase